MAAQRTVFVNSDGDEQQFDTLGSDTAHRNDASRVVVVNSDGDEQNLVTAGSTSPIPGAFQQVVLVNSAGVEQEIGAVGTADPIPSRYVQAVIVDEDGAEMLVETLGGVTPIPAKFRQLLAVNSDGDGQTFTIGTPISLTLSGNEITDAVRAAGVSGDGLSPEGSMGVWEDTTNLCTNGGFETNTTGWGGNGTGTVSRVTSQAKFGSASLQVVVATATGPASSDGCTSPQTAVGSFASGDAATASAWFKADLGTTVRIQVLGRNAAGAILESSSADFVATGEWQRASITATLSHASTSRANTKLLLYTAGATGTFYADGVQIEKQPLATPYVETDGGTASRSASGLGVPTGIINATQSWVAFRLRRNWGTANEPYAGSGFQVILKWQDDATNYLNVYYVESTNTWQFDRRNTSGSPAVGGSMGATGFGTGTEMMTVIAAWTSAGRYISTNGAAFVPKEGSPEYPPTLSSAPNLLVQPGGYWFDSDCFWFACGTGTLSDADAATIHGWGNPDPPPGLFPSAAAVKLIWRAIDSTARTY